VSATFREPSALEELLADEALVGLSAEDRHALAAFEPAAVIEDETALFALAAGEVAAAAAEHAEPEPMPPAVAARLQEMMAARVAAKPASVEIERNVVAALPVPTRTRFIPWALAAAAIVFAFVSWNRPSPKAVTATTTDPAPTAASERARLLGLPGTARLDFTATKDPAAQRASGDVVWHSGLQRGFMRIAGLLPNDPRQLQYQLWVFDAERGDTYPVDGGVFDVTSTGEVVVPINAKLAVGKAKLFAITVERPGGVVVSKRERIVLTATTPS
jgi:anti-sigma-K factor RskA